jgi:predicted RNA binding protein YcfA (HicA-like mRNA interferase family)
MLELTSNYSIADADAIAARVRDPIRLWSLQDIHAQTQSTRSVTMPAAWDNGIAARFMPKRYTSRELVKLAEEFGWMLVGVRGDHHNFKHPASRFIVTIVHPQKDVPVGRAVDTVKKIKLEIK